MQCPAPACPQVATADPTEYRNVTKPALKKAIADLERDWGGPPAHQPGGGGGGGGGGAGGGGLGAGGREAGGGGGGGGGLLGGMGLGLLGGGGGGGAAAAPAGVLGAEWVVVYVRPPELDVGDKGVKKVRAGVGKCACVFLIWIWAVSRKTARGRHVCRP